MLYRGCSNVSLMTTSAVPHLFWITSRAAGIVALVLASVTVSLGLLMSTRLLRKRGPDLLALHEVLSMSALVAIAVHGVTLLGDRYLHPSLVDIAVPFAGGYRAFWTSLGIIGGWGMALLGVSYYLRRYIGAARWRSLHRLTALMWLAGLGHALGEGTDAGQAWFLVMMAIVAIPALALLATRRLGASPPSAAPPRSRERGARPGSEARRVPDHEPGEFSPALRPAAAAVGQGDRVEAPAGHLHPHVAGVGVDAYPATRAGVAVALEVARDHR